MMIALATGTAAADRPRPVTVEIDPALRVEPAAAASSRIIFLHRCPITGCPVSPGPDDSRTDRSSIAQGARTIGAFNQSQAVWDAFVACVRTTYAVFDLVVTDTSPGNVPHFEHIVGGKPTDLRADIPDAGGVAPATCTEIPNAMTFTFDVFGPDPDTLCWTASQEIAHAFGLEHEYSERDPMTYLGDASPRKRFQFAPHPCGEYQARGCACQPGQQSSYKRIVALFGAGPPTAPAVSIRSPSSGTRVQPHFVTRVDADDDVAIDRVELYIDGALSGMAQAPPYRIAAPDGLAEGPHTVEARAIDVTNTPGSTTVDVELGPPCTASAGCEPGTACVMGVCVAGPGSPGGLGSACQADTECDSLRCAHANDGQFCVEACDLSPGSCPSDFYCLEDGRGAGVCWPSDTGGCCGAGARPTGPLLLALGVLAAVRRRRRR